MALCVDRHDRRERLPILKAMAQELRSANDPEAYFGVALRIVGRMARGLPEGVDVESLRQSALVAVVRAAPRISGSGETAGAFIAQRVRGAVLDELRAMDAVGRRTRTLVKRARAVAAALSLEPDHPANDAVIAEKMGVSVAALRDARRVVCLVAQPFGEDQAILAVPDGGISPCVAAECTDICEVVAAAIARLPEGERAAIRYFYCTEGTTELDDKRARARHARRRDRALRMLRAYPAVGELMQQRGPGRPTGVGKLSQ